MDTKPREGVQSGTCLHVNGVAVRQWTYEQTSQASQLNQT
jgi:hypothetical protein